MCGLGWAGRGLACHSPSRKRLVRPLPARRRCGRMGAAGPPGFWAGHCIRNPPTRHDILYSFAHPPTKCVGRPHGTPLRTGVKGSIFNIPLRASLDDQRCPSYAQGHLHRALVTTPLRRTLDTARPHPYAGLVPARFFHTLLRVSSDASPSPSYAPLPPYACL